MIVHRKTSRSAGAGLLLVLLLGVSSAPAQPEPLTRGRAVSTALARDARISAAAARELVARAHRAQVRAARSPSVTAVLAAGPSLKAELVPGSAVASTENTYGDVGLDDLSLAVGGRFELAQPLYTFGKLAARQQAAEHELSARRAETDMTRADVAYQVAELYESLLLARDAERFFEETDHWLARTLESAREELDAGGPATEQDIGRYEAARAAGRLGWSRARSGRRQAEAGLVVFLALPGGALPPLVEQGLEPLPVELPALEALVASALRHRPELAALKGARAAFGALARAEAAGNRPDLFALLFASAAYTPGRDVADSRYVQDPLNGFYPGLLVGARWQLTPGMSGARADEQRALASQYAELERFARTGIPAEVVRALEDVRRARADLEEAQAGVASAKRWLVRAEADAAVGLDGPEAVTDAASAYVELRLAWFDAAFRHNVGLASLARATGTLGAGPGSYYPDEDP